MAGRRPFPALLAGTIAAAALSIVPGVATAAPASSAIAQSAQTSDAMAFLAALGRLDFAAAGAFLDEEAVLDLPYAGQGVTVRGRAGILRFFEQTMAKSTGRVEYRLDRAYPSVEAGATVLEISTQGQTAAGRAYTNRLIAVFEFRDGRIVLFREYFNPVPVR